MDRVLYRNFIASKEKLIPAKIDPNNVDFRQPYKAVSCIKKERLIYGPDLEYLGLDFQEIS